MKTSQTIRPNAIASLPEQYGSLAEEYHVATRNPGVAKRVFKTHEAQYSQYLLDLASSAPLRRDAASRVALPSPVAVTMPLEQAITRRTSGRDYASTPLDVAQLAGLLILANGIRETIKIDSGELFYQRNVPSAGNLGSAEVFPIVMNVAGVEPGIYHFDTVDHDLACLHRGQYRTWLEELVLFQLELPRAAVALVLTCALGRLAAKYGQRGYRLGLMDIGHVSQNVQLVATALGLAACATAGFIDEELDAALGLDGVETASMLVLLVGPPEGHL